LKKVENGYQWAGVQSGMDNTPRKGGLWIDAIAQQGLSALCISRMADRLGDKAMAQQWRLKYEAIRDTVNKLYWDETDGIYYDIDPRTLEHLKVKTPASYWPMLAEMCTPQQAARMAKLVADPDVFGGERPWTTVARNDPAFTRPDGNYWRGAIWLPTAYMGTKALEKYGYYALADDAAERLLGQMLRTYQNYQPHTIWECYSPTRDSPADHRGRRVRPNFCGWSALGPISLFIENVLGFHVVDAQNRRVEWRLHHAQRHGIRNLRFGDVTTDILYDGHGHVTVTTNAPYTLIINGQSSPIHPGTNTLDANPTDPPNTH
jgi:glycogen debranching enzyme